MQYLWRQKQNGLFFLVVISCQLLYVLSTERTVIKGISFLLKDCLRGAHSGCHQGLNLWPTLLFMHPHVYPSPMPFPMFLQASIFNEICPPTIPILHVSLHRLKQITHTHTKKEHQLDLRLSVFVNFSSAFLVTHQSVCVCAHVSTSYACVSLRVCNCVFAVTLRVTHAISVCPIFFCVFISSCVCVYACLL